MSIIDKIQTTTKETIRSRLDSFIIDRNTNHYNDLFMKEYLYNYLEYSKTIDNQPNLFILVLYVDNIDKINIRHSTKVGDETIKNLGYVLDQMKSETEMIFKWRGPGYIIGIHDLPSTNIKKRADAYQNAVKNSETFIEPITVSAAAVHISETDASLSSAKRVDSLISKAIERINLSRELPDNYFIDKNTVVNRENLGRILVVDDNPLSTAVAKDFFERNKYQVTIVKDGITALNISKTDYFDVIIADRFALKMDAITLKQYINDSSINMNTVFILIVHNKSLSIVQKANHAGIDYIVTQPVIYEEILGFILREAKKRAKLCYEL